MTSQINIGVSNNKKTVKDFYIGVGNKPRKVLKGWIGVDNKPRLFYNFSGLPRDFIEAEWILNDDPFYQYIDTGVLCDSNTRIVLDIEFYKLLSRAYICGVKNNTDESNYTFPNYQLLSTSYNSGYYLYYGNTNTSIQLGKKVYTGHEIIDLNNNGNFIINGDILYTSNEEYINDYIENPNNYDSSNIFPYLILYGTLIKNSNNTFTYQGSSGISQFKLYGCQIYQNNKLIRNFIPCHYTKNDLDPYNHGYLYDTVNKKIYSCENPDAKTFLSSVESE